MLKQFRMVIGDQSWTFTLYEDDAFEQLHGKNFDAMCMPDECEIDFSESGLSLKTVYHELIHAHVKYLYLDSATISIKAFEEIFCEMISDKYSVIERQANRIYKELSKK